MVRRGKSLFAVATAAVAVIAGACSSNSSKSSTSTTAKPATGAAASPTTAAAAAGSPATCTGPGISNGTIKVGVIPSIEGQAIASCEENPDRTVAHVFAKAYLQTRR